MRFSCLLTSCFIFLLSNQVSAASLKMVGSGNYKTMLEAKRGCAGSLRSYFVDFRAAANQALGTPDQLRATDVIEGHSCGGGVPNTDDHRSKCPQIPGLYALFAQTFEYPGNVYDDIVRDTDTDAVGWCGYFPRVQPTPTTGPTCSSAGNPVSILTGNKFQVVTDYRSNQPFPLQLTRTYNSQLGGLWTLSYSDFLEMSNPVFFQMYSSNGKLHRLYQSADPTIYRDINNPGIVLSFDEASDQWVMTTPQQLTYYFSNLGLLTKITNVAGLSHTIERNIFGGIYRVNHSLGGFIQFTRTYMQSAVLNAATTSEGLTIEYDYQDIKTEIINGETIESYRPSVALHGVRIKYNDGITADFTESYLYESPIAPYLLTGIIDGRGVNYASWTYDESLRAISSSHANNADNTLFSYNLDPNTNQLVSTTVTNSLGKDTVYYMGNSRDSYATQAITRVEGQASENCVAANKAYGYSRGYITSATDWNGNVTRYERDEFGREISRTSGYGTAEATTTFTEWHPTHNTISRIIEPARQTLYSYDEQGLLINTQIIPVAQ